MSDTVIDSDTRITLFFEIAFEDGTVVDTCFGDNPATFTFGDGSLLPGFEQALTGMRSGERKQMRLLPEQAFGERHEGNIQRFPLTQFPDDQTIVPGLVMAFADKQGAELPGVVTHVGELMVTIDFNHPLAGRTLLFDADIIAVEAV
jgi:FKBP-type peptidyl-prolyl cis-trans isomerase SlpA